MPVLKLSPAFKDYVWGGTKLVKDFNKTYSGEILAESWELSVHPDGLSAISGGELNGMSLNDYLEKYPESAGSNCKNKSFPILIKLIDAKNALSVQVHPDDEYAQIHENSAGKTEMWIVLDCEQGAYIYLGFERKITKDEFIKRVNDNTLIEVLKKITVKKGDVFYIPAGTIHAMGEGLVIAEIQQSSNLTYRVYDYGRKGADGKTRELHIDKAVDVTRLDCNQALALGECDEIIQKDYTIKTLTDNNYFRVERLKLNGEYIRKIKKTSFLSILCTDGKCMLTDGQSIYEVNKGGSFFVTAGDYDIVMQGNGEFILTGI